MGSCTDHSCEAHPIVKACKPVPSPRATLVLNNRSFHWITERICGIIEEPAPLWWKVMFAVALFIASFTFIGLAYLVSTGVGTWGLRSPVSWGWDITNFVFWVGIGHAGTLI